MAYKYQYDSPEAFSRAFKSVLGVSPSRLKKSDVQLMSFPKIDLRKSDEPLLYEVVDKESFHIRGYKKRFSAEEIVDGRPYSEFWKEKASQIDQLCKENHSGCRVGAGAYQTNQKYYDAVIGIFGEGEDTVEVQASRWCIFKGKGPLKTELSKLWQRIFLEWFPLTDFQHSGKLELEVFYEGDLTSQDYDFEIWIPLTK